MWENVSNCEIFPPNSGAEKVLALRGCLSLAELWFKSLPDDVSIASFIAYKESWSELLPGYLHMSFSKGPLQGEGQGSLQEVPGGLPAPGHGTNPVCEQSGGPRTGAACRKPPQADPQTVRAPEHHPDRPGTAETR